jgi:hypothetical protein
MIDTYCIECENLEQNEFNDDVHYGKSSINYYYCSLHKVYTVQLDQQIYCELIAMHKELQYIHHWWYLVES